MRADNHHHHSHNKPVLCISILVALISGLIFFNSALDDENPSERFNFSTNTLLKTLFSCLALLAGANIMHEIKDHLLPIFKFFFSPAKEKSVHTTPRKTPHSSETRTDNATIAITDETTTGYASQPLLDSSTSSSSYGGVVRFTKPAPPRQNCTINLIKLGISLPLLGISGYALHGQCTSLMEAFSVSDYSTQQLSALPFSAISTIGFLSVPFGHFWANISGVYKEFTEEVTHHEVTKYSFYVRVPLFIFLTLTHLVESALISNAVSGFWGWASTVSLASLRSFSHLDHALAVKDVYNTVAAYPSGKKCKKMIVGLTSGIAHTAPGVLGTIYFWDKAPTWTLPFMCISDVVDFLLGWLEHHQHMGRDDHAHSAGATTPNA